MAEAPTTKRSIQADPLGSAFLQHSPNQIRIFAGGVNVLGLVELMKRRGLLFPGIVGDTVNFGTWGLSLPRLAGWISAVPCVARRCFPVMGTPTPESSRSYSPRRCLTFNHTTVSLSPG